MTIYVRGANPIWSMVDPSTGLPLNDEYWAIFLTNTFPYIPQPPTHDFSGENPWANGMVQFTPGGTLPNDLYFNPDLVYRIEVRRGNTQADPLIYLVENYVPSEGSVNNNNDLLSNDNQITNPQFSEVDFDSPFTYTQSLSGTYVLQIANGWELELVGQGTTTLTQLELSGTDDIQGNPPYALRFNNSGWDSATLRQIFVGNGAIFSNGAVSMNATVRASVTSQSITFSYVPSAPGTPTEILTELVGVGDFVVVKGAVNLPASTNTNIGDAAFVAMEIELEATGIMDITNVQVLGQSVPLPDDFNVDTDTPLFIETTPERQIDEQFHNYKDALIAKPIPSYLVGWDFPLNPAQNGDTVPASAFGANKSEFTWDQTILFQSTDNSLGVTRGANGEYLVTATATTQAALVYYFDQTEARKLLNSPIAINISARTSTGLLLTGTASFYYTTDVSLPAMSSNNSIVGTLDANGKPATFNGNWTEVPVITSLKTEFTVNESGDQSFNDYMLNGWDMSGDAAISTVTYAALVIGFESMASTDTIGINSVGVCSGAIATRPAPKTQNEVFEDCQLYYEKSYPKGSPAGTSTVNGMQQIIIPSVSDGSTTGSYVIPFTINFMTTKRIVPTMTFYTPTGTVDNISVGVNDSNGVVVQAAADKPLTQFTLLSSSTERISYNVNNTTTAIRNVGPSVNNYQGYMEFHYIADCRLGS